MPRALTKTVYKLSELSPKAKDRAIEHWRELQSHDEIHESIYEDAKTCLAYFGFTEIEISYSGFGSQGDGASFTAHWSAAAVQPGKIQEHAPTDTRLARLDVKFTTLAARCKQMSATITRTTGQYVHENSVHISADFGDEAGDDNGTPEEKLLAHANAVMEVELGGYARQCMRWIYEQLETEWNHQNSDDYIAESIEANEREFDDDGNLI